jgi:hypothetical protein
VIESRDPKKIAEARLGRLPIDYSRRAGRDRMVFRLLPGWPFVVPASAGLLAQSGNLA